MKTLEIIIEIKYIFINLCPQNFNCPQKYARNCPQKLPPETARVPNFLTH